MSAAAVPGLLSLDAFSPEARALIETLAAQRPAASALWLVGGAVRDALLGAAPRELDLVVPAGALDLGRALAARAGAAFVTLDADRGVGRVMGPVRMDLADFRAPTLEGDLAARDFTVNALAVPVAALAATGRAPVTDPTGGLADLAAGRVRLCAPDALGDDPVRILRAARLAV
ncbi:MAG TPA: hypothetical protein VJU81_24120, partial [Methylomirabilota bacterium]|nr:hypothetical protein [Methylomirabilota bacterium]